MKARSILGCVLASLPALALATAGESPAFGPPCGALGRETSWLEVRQGSHLEADGALVAGHVVDCGSVPRLRPMLRAAHEALASIPEELRPRLVVHVAPTVAPGLEPVDGIEVHRSSRSILVSENGRGSESASVWLHEAAHVLMHRDSEDSPIERRVLDAVEEGLADYFAAVLSGSPRVGDDTERRDLSRSAPPRPERWLALAGERFDPHVFGFELAAELWREESERAVLAEDAIVCLRDFRRTQRHLGPGSLVTDLTRTCPARSRRRLERVFERWVGV